MKKPFFAFYFVLFVVHSFATTAYGAVKIGAGAVKEVEAPIKTQQDEAETTDLEARAVIEQQRKTLPLAQSVAEAFRTEVDTLKKSLAEQATQKLKPEERHLQQAKFNAYIDTDYILSLYTQTLLTYFTEDELKTLRTFLGTPEGQTVFEKLPEVLNKMQLDRQFYLQRVLNQLVEEQVYEKLRKGEKTLLTP